MELLFFLLVTNVNVRRIQDTSRVPTTVLQRAPYTCLYVYHIVHTTCACVYRRAVRGTKDEVWTTAFNHVRARQRHNNFDVTRPSVHANLSAYIVRGARTCNFKLHSKQTHRRFSSIRRSECDGKRRLEKVWFSDRDFVAESEGEKPSFSTKMGNVFEDILQRGIYLCPPF